MGCQSDEMKVAERAEKGNSIRGLNDFSFGTVELRVRFKYMKAGKERLILDIMCICTGEDKRIKSQARELF